MGGLAQPAEVVVPFAVPREQVPKATLVRTTLLMSSLRALREAGHFEKYRQIIPREKGDAILAAVGPQWVPVDLATAHYTACDRLELTPSELVELGLQVAKHAQGTFVKTIVSVVTTAGATPWTALQQGRRMWERAWVGSGLAVFKVGPKEARLEIVGCPCAGIPYFRIANRGILQSVVQLLATRAYVQEIPRKCSDWDLTYKIQWA